MSMSSTKQNKVLVIGSGPIIIGQAAEFDYAGTQACRALKEEGFYTVLVNTNPATIMTDLSTADAIYIEPLTVPSVTRIIQEERPDGILATLGGQTGLNLAVQLAEEGVLDKYSVSLLGTPLSAIKKAEDRDLFRQLLTKLKEPFPNSFIATTTSEAINKAHVLGLPVVVRPAYTLGGTGGGIDGGTDPKKFIALYEDIKKNKMIEPIVVKQYSKKTIKTRYFLNGKKIWKNYTNENGFQVINGAHRLAAMIFLGSEEIPVKIYNSLSFEVPNYTDYIKTKETEYKENLKMK